MAGKVLRILLLATPLITGCASWEKKTVATPTEDKQMVSPAVRTMQPAATSRRPRANSTAPQPRSNPQPKPSPSASSSASAFILTKPGAPPTQPVPLFRQAIVLASVRASVADLPNPPQAEFRQGLLTLTFPAGSAAEVTSAVNRAMAVPEVNRVQVIPAP